MRRVQIVVIVFLALTAHTAFAQRPSIPMPRPAPMPSGHATPAPGSRVRSTLVFRDGRVPPNAFSLRRLNRNTGVVALPFFWSWGAPAFYVDAPVQLLTGDVPTGGVQLDVTPWRSQVYVDGVLMGRVDDFRGYYHPLVIAAGPHQIAIVDHGRQPILFEVVVTPGRTMTYRATLDESLAP
jgi:hypothetical protein